jgi:hypothetical protein
MKFTKVLCAVTLAACTGFSQAAWTGAHGESDNRGFAKVNTRPAQFPIRTVDVGHVAPGANAVTAPDGTVYIGNVDGYVIALHADGSPYWTRQLGPAYGGIYNSPVVGADGSVYVVSSRHYTDHRTGVAVAHNDSYLHKFNAGGAWEFPMLFPAVPSMIDRGGLTAAPNIWRADGADGAEAIMVLVIYQGPNFADLRLIAFSTAGAVLDQKSVAKQTWSADVSGSDGGVPSSVVEFIFNCIFSPWNLVLPGWECVAGFAPGPYVPDMLDAGFPLPGIAIRPNPRGGDPQVVASGLHDTVVYSFSQTALSEAARGTEKATRVINAPPVVLNDGEVAIGVNVFGTDFNSSAYLRLLRGTDFSPVIPIPSVGYVTAAPTVLFDGRSAVISRDGTLTLIAGRTVTMQDPLNGASIASAAASCTHLFVSSENEFRTYDLTNMAVVASLPLQRGGRHSPIIGPGGHVYAMTEFGMNVFPAPRQRPGAGGLAQCGSPAATSMPSPGHASPADAPPDKARRSAETGKP